MGVLSIATTENQEVEGLYSFSVTNSNNHLLVLTVSERGKIPAVQLLAAKMATVAARDPSYPHLLS